MKRNLQIISTILFALAFATTLRGQADTVVINVGDSSKMIFQIANQKDLQTLKQYDLQAVVKDLISKLEQRDTSALTTPAAEYAKTETTEQATAEKGEDWDSSWKRRDRSYRDLRNVGGRTRYYSRSTFHSINFDFGTNNYLNNGQFPDGNNVLYTVRPWGSWYVGAASTQRTRLARIFFLEWGFGVSWYNFKFQNDRVTMGKDDNGVIFSEDLRDVDFRKSKLTACYLNASFVPMIDFGGNRRKSMFFDNRHSQSVRFGAGPYVGYRVSSYTKQVYKDDGDKQKDRNHDNFYLNNIRYGIRVQFGFSDIDFFFNYDMNDLFVENKGPKLNAFSFGITL